jgi:hypothetical protein
MSEPKTHPDDLMIVLRTMAKNHGYSLTKVEFTPTVRPSCDTVEYSYSTEYAGVTDMKTGFETLHIADGH